MSKIYLGNEAKSLAVKITAKYTRADDSELVKLTEVKDKQMKELDLTILPSMDIDQDGQKFKNYSTYSIMGQISRLTNFEKIFLGRNESDTTKIMTYFETIPKYKDEKLADFLQETLKLRPFLVTYNVTAADIFAYAHVVEYIKTLTKEQKIEKNNLFRWIDYIQHLQGIEKFVSENNLFIESPIEEEEVKKTGKVEEEKKMSKSQLKKMLKQQKIAEKKAAKLADQKDGTNETSDAPQKEKKPKKKKNPPKKKEEVKGEKVDYNAEPITLIDFKIGHIDKVYNHPESSNLYCCHIDIGEEEPRTIATGLQGVVPIEKLENATVVIAANLKARNMGGFRSDGMVL